MTDVVTTLQKVLNDADPNRIADGLRKVRIGDVLSPVKVTVAALVATATPDITSTAVKAAITGLSGLSLQPGEMLPAILSVRALRVTGAGTGATGPYVVSDVGATPLVPYHPAAVDVGPGVVRLSDDGKTLTFSGTVTGFVLEYMPRSASALSAEFDKGI